MDATNTLAHRALLLGRLLDVIPRPKPDLT
ncbi:hypothetical protein LZ554_001623 [Drepanopeziza brunnea f. sp. 'monogermtubi']|nr:hypothetical protein LZ554_001623 [Drepanopeziza brunnea f. sp. 'monogermtubi']